MAAKLVTKEIIDNMRRQNMKKESIMTGYADLDCLMGGLKEGNLYVLGGRPAMGKTQLALQICANMAQNEDSSVLFFSLEMSLAQLMRKYLSIYCQEKFHNVEDVENQEGMHAKEAMKYAIDHLDSHMWVDDTPGISVKELSELVNKMKRDNNLKCVIIDYAHLIISDKKHKSYKEEIEYIYSSLRKLAKESNCTIIALAQLPRDIEYRPDKRPMLSDIFAADEYADVVMFLYRDEYYYRESDYKGTAELIIAKNNDGPVGTVCIPFSTSCYDWIKCFDEFKL